MKRLELLAPAKNLQCGIAAIDSGADAVYIGGPKFGARAAAGNSLEDIATLTAYAHQFGAKVYVTLNTLIRDDELDEMRSLLEQICAIGVDAILVQDMAMLRLADGKRIALHASTQTDNRDKEKVGWLKSLGFSRVVLARELSLEEIRAIHEAHPDIELEVFVHGALCVSYSGACYASEYCFNRSANRGECAQFCRMKFDLLDSEGTVLKRQSHLLSLKDLRLIDHLEELADAGAVSFKIEGRLKDESYVRNVVAAYSQKLDAICQSRPADYCRASIGTVEYDFKPDLSKTFNRGYTEYFFRGRVPDIYSPDTPKAIGEKVGVVKSISSRTISARYGGGVIRLAPSSYSFTAGDGLCFFDSNNELVGFRVNRAEGNILYPHIMPHGLHAGMTLWRNHDEAFEKLLTRNASRRFLPINLIFSVTPNGFSLTADGARAEIEFPHQLAEKPQRANIISQLSRWGGTIYKVESIEIQSDADKYFIPSSMLSTLRKQLAATLTLQQQGRRSREEVSPGMNKARLVGVSARPEVLPDVSPGMNELASDSPGTRIPTINARPVGLAPNITGPLMECRHCLRYALGHCRKYPNGASRAPLSAHGPLFLRLSDGRKFRLSFDCARCLMLVYKHP